MWSDWYVHRMKGLWLPLLGNEINVIVIRYHLGDYNYIA